MKVMSMKVTIVLFFMVSAIIGGCADMLDTERPPLLFKKVDVKRKKSDEVWSRDFGPEQSGHFRSVATGDFNNDGKTDIIGGSYEPGVIFLWYGDGSGNWERVQRFKIRGDIRSLDVGDVNNDGWLDIVSSSLGDSNGVQAWINDKGLFKEGAKINEKGFYNGIKIADIDNDGNQDVIAANSTQLAKAGVQVWMGDGKGNFLKETGPTLKYMYNDVDVGDFNNDGRLDIVGAAWGFDGGAVRVWLGAGDGRWSEVESIVEKGSYFGVDVADVDGDGNPDIISAANFDGVTIHYGDGKGGFSRKDTLSETGNFWRAKAVDLNNDGLLDIVGTLTDNNGIVLWYQGNKKRRNSWMVAKDETLPKRGFYFDVDFADFNADSLLDIVATTYGEGVKVWLRGIHEPTDVDIIEEVGTVPVFNTSIFFDTDTADFAEESISTLNNITEVLTSVEGTVLNIRKHADSRGYNYNNLCDERIKVVTDLFLSRGISRERIELIDWGIYDVEGDGNVWEDSRYSGELDCLEPRVDVAVNYGKSSGRKHVSAKQKSNTSIEDFPFREKGDLIPVKEYKTWKLVDGIPEYRIGSKDRLNVTFWVGLEEKEYDVVVSPQNTVSFSYIKNHPASGFTPTELERIWTEQLSDVIKDPFIKVEVEDGNKHAYTASIFGAVRSLARQPTGPGVYTLYGKEHFTEFLARVGGHLPEADLTRVQLTREKKNYFINIFDALFRSDFRQDVIVEDEDVFFIPTKTEVKNRVFVLGEVQRPGLFSFDQSITLLDAVISAGGPTVFGKPRNVLIVRGDIEKPEVTRVNLMDVVQRGDFRQNIPLNNGDVVYVARNLLGDLQNLVRAFGPFLAITSLPSNIYDATSIPKIKGFPFEREPAPSVQEIITQPQLPQQQRPWQASEAK